MSGGFNMTVREYNGLSAIFFLPNLPTPLIAGVMAQRIGPGPVYIFFLAFALLGNILVACAALSPGAASLRWLLAGRLLMGISYEAADMVPIGLLSPHFKHSWATVVGLINGSNRLGSVCNFLLEPLVLQGFGLSGALLLPSALGACTFAIGVYIYRTEWRIRKVAAEAKPAGAQSSSSIGAPATEAAPRAPPLSLRSLRAFSPCYWFYLAGCACVYGAVVPFWFIGAKHIAVKFKMSLAMSDAFLLWPEGAIAIIAPPFGLLIDRQRWRLRTRLNMAALSMLPVATAHTVLGLSSLPPLLAVGLLGVGNACAQNLVWCTITIVS